MPKPLVPVAGVPLIEWVIGNFLAAGITSLVAIVNEQARECRDLVHARFPDLDAEVIVKTTPSSLESFFEINRRLGGGRALVSTVDAWCRTDDFVRFVEAALRRPPDASVLAVTPLVADENPLWVDVAAASRLRALGDAPGGGCGARRRPRVAGRGPEARRLGGDLGCGEIGRRRRSPPPRSVPDVRATGDPLSSARAGGPRDPSREQSAGSAERVPGA